MEQKKLLQLAGTLAVGVILWFTPPPDGVDIRAWHLLAIFVATIVGIVTSPLPMGAVAIFGIAATSLTGTLTIEQSVSGFGERVIWLIVIAFFVSRGLSLKLDLERGLHICSWLLSARRHSAWPIAS